MEEGEGQGERDSPTQRIEEVPDHSAARCLSQGMPGRW